jgi:hypothetical protein
MSEVMEREIRDQIVTWLESPDGEKWSRALHKYGWGMPPLMSIKDDMEIDDDVRYLWVQHA